MTNDAKTQHTPGPWMAFEDGEVWNLDGNILICDTDLPSGFNASRKTYGEANARLIAAAPELLEVCIELVYQAERKMKTPDIVEMAERALTKAEGRAS